MEGGATRLQYVAFFGLNTKEISHEEFWGREISSHNGGSKTVAAADRGLTDESFFTPNTDVK